MKISLILLFGFFLPTALAEEMQDIYEYKDKKGVVEFTDEIKPDETLEKHVQIKRSTAEENAVREEKLELIMAKDKELDKKLAIERKKERQQELALKQQREAAKAEQLRKQQAEQQWEQYNNGNPYWRQGSYPPYGPMPPHRPDYPETPVQLPAQLPAGN
jgi:hypothetical protein